MQGAEVDGGDLSSGDCSPPDTASGSEGGRTRTNIVRSCYWAAYSATCARAPTAVRPPAPPSPPLPSPTRSRAVLVQRLLPSFSALLAIAATISRQALPSALREVYPRRVPRPTCSALLRLRELLYHPPTGQTCFAIISLLFSLSRYLKGDDGCRCSRSRPTSCCHTDWHRPTCDSARSFRPPPHILVATILVLSHFASNVVDGALWLLFRPFRSG